MSTNHAVGSVPFSAAALAFPALLLALLSYAVLFDQGLLGGAFSDATLASGGVLHEFFHDARHLLGVPCH